MTSRSAKAEVQEMGKLKGKGSDRRGGKERRERIICVYYWWPGKGRKGWDEMGATGTAYGRDTPVSPGQGKTDSLAPWSLPFGGCIVYLTSQANHYCN